MRRYWVWTWGCFLFMFSLGTAGAADLELFKSERFQGGPWRIRAESITYDAGNHTYLAQGRVEIRQGDRRITADQVQVNEVTKIAWLKGNVVMLLDEDVFTGQEGHLNLATRCGEMHGARLFLKRNHFHLDSPMIRKTGEGTYYATKAVVTTCDADRPAWSFAASTLSVVLEGYATGKDTSVRLAGCRFFMSPLRCCRSRLPGRAGFCCLPTGSTGPVGR